MLNVSCLMKDTALKEALFDVIEVGVLLRATNGKSTSLQGIYRDLRNSGIEVDIETVGYIYNEIFQSEPGFTSEADIEIITTRAFRDSVNRLAENEKLVGERQITEQPAETAVANLIVDALYENIVDDERTISDQKTLQDALWKGVRRILGPLDPKKQDKKSMVELIDQALGWENIGVMDLNGRLNSISDLFQAMKDKLAEASDAMRSGDADQVAMDRYNAYVKHLENATYKLLFSRIEAKRVLTDAMKAAGFGKTLKSGSTVIDWNKLAGNAGNISDLRTNVDVALTQAGYPQAVIDRVKDTLQQEFIDMRAEIVDRQMQNSDRFASEGTKDVKEEAGLRALLAGRSEAQWIKEEKVENVEDLHKKVNAALAGKTYEPSIIKKIQDRVTKFFTENYAKVASAEAQRAIDDILGDQTALEWIKANGIQNQNELNDALATALSGRTMEPQNEIAIRDEFNRILDINARAERELHGREKRIEQEYKSRKSDMQRMLELYHLGVFQRSHEDLLYRALGVDELTVEDLHDLEQLAKVASDMSRKIADPKSKHYLGSDVFASREFQRLQRHIDSIITRNINNKSRLMKILSAIKNYFDVMLSSLLGMPSTILQNILSGAQSVLTALRFNAGEGGWTRTKQAFMIWKAMFLNVGATGQSYGEEIGSFATQELFTNTLKWKWKDATVKEKALSFLHASTIYLRLGLLAADSANKVALTNKVFYNVVYNSLVKHNGIPKEEATRLMNGMLYGTGKLGEVVEQNGEWFVEMKNGNRKGPYADQATAEANNLDTFSQAMQTAKELIEENNSKLDPKFRSKVTKSEIITLANDVVKANLNIGNIVDKKVLEVALKSAYHVAGLQLGHEPNNPMSSGIKGLRDLMRNNEKAAVAKKDWGLAARTKLQSTLTNVFLVRFAGGATNWLFIRLKHGLGLGIVTGLANRPFRDLDFSDQKNIKEEIIARESARADIARSVIGAMYTGVWFALGYAIVGNRGSSDEDKDRLEHLRIMKEKGKLNDKTREELDKLESHTSVYKEIKANRRKNRYFKALAPDLMLMNYYVANDKKNNKKSGMVSYVMNTYFGSERFGPNAKLGVAFDAYHQGDNEAGDAAFLSIAGDQFSIPILKPANEWVTVLSGNPFKESKPYIPPTSWQDAFLAGGALEELGLYERKTRITAVPGVGMAAYERLKKVGIKDLGDLKDNPTWYMKKDSKGFILDADDRLNAKKFTEAYLKN